MSELVPETGLNPELVARFDALHAATGHAEAIAANPDSAVVFAASCTACRRALTSTEE